MEISQARAKEIIAEELAEAGLEAGEQEVASMASFWGEETLQDWRSEDEFRGYCKCIIDNLEEA